MKIYTITLINKKKQLNITLPIKSNEIILNMLEKNNIILPYSCKIGACSTCVCKIVKGSIIHFNQTFLSEIELKNKFILPCVAYPTSNLILLTHMENDLYQ